jgi:hypothetical protein
LAQCTPQSNPKLVFYRTFDEGDLLSFGIPTFFKGGGRMFFIGKEAMGER